MACTWRGKYHRASARFWQPRKDFWRAFIGRNWQRKSIMMKKVHFDYIQISLIWLPGPADHLWAQHLTFGMTSHLPETQRENTRERVENTSVVKEWEDNWWSIQSRWLLWWDNGIYLWTQTAWGHSWPSDVWSRVRGSGPSLTKRKETRKEEEEEKKGEKEVAGY